MSAEIKDLASTCDACQSVGRAQQKGSLMPIEANSRGKLLVLTFLHWITKSTYEQ